MQIFVDGKKRARPAGSKGMLSAKAAGGSPVTGEQLLRELGISPQEALIKVDGKVRPEGAAIGHTSKVEIIRVVFGG